jgi:hypothetical protein
VYVVCGLGDGENAPQAAAAVHAKLPDSRRLRQILRLLCNGNAEARGLRQRLARPGRAAQVRLRIVTSTRDINGNDGEAMFVSVDL